MSNTARVALLITCVATARCASGSLNYMVDEEHLARSLDENTETAPEVTLVGDDPAGPWRFFGRTAAFVEAGRDPNEVRVLSFAASGVQALVVGTGFTMDLRFAAGSSARFTLWIDAQQPREIEANSRLRVNKLSNSVHLVRLVKRNDATFGSAIFGGFVPDAGGSLAAAPRLPARRVQFVGDGFVTGAGDLGGSGACTLRDDAEDAEASFAGVTARTLAADYMVVGATGVGVYESPNAFGRVADVWQRAAADDVNSRWQHDRWQPDAIVVTAGAADFAANRALQSDSAPFVRAYRELVSTLRKTHPAAHVFITVGPDGRTDADAARGAAIGAVQQGFAMGGDAHVHLVRLVSPGYGSGKARGCGGYPNAAAHGEMAAAAVDALRTTLGW